eukprot:11201324-Lingulodinium_polyedra.AAC.1
MYSFLTAPPRAPAGARGSANPPAARAAAMLGGRPSQAVGRLGFTGTAAALAPAQAETALSQNGLSQNGYG